jgi:hypothetical protein
MNASALPSKNSSSGEHESPDRRALAEIRKEMDKRFAEVIGAYCWGTDAALAMSVKELCRLSILEKELLDKLVEHWKEPRTE